MDRQEAFNIVYTKLMEQGRKSISDSLCQYAGEDNTHCAIGWIAKERGVDNYTLHKWDNTGYDARQIARYLGVAELSLFFDKLQQLHDETDTSIPFGEDFPARAKVFAEKHELTIPELS